MKDTLRIPIGFAAGLVFILRADPVIASFCAGVAVMFFGEVIRFVSAGTLIKYEGVTHGGIYSYTRNPLYIGSFFIGLGACIIGRDIVFTAFFLIAYPLIYIRVIKKEEKYLIHRYGAEYERYIGEVPRFWPKGLKIGEIFRESAVFLAVKNRELLTVAGIIAILAVMLIKMFYR